MLSMFKENYGIRSLYQGDHPSRATSTASTSVSVRVAPPPQQQPPPPSAAKPVTATSLVLARAIRRSGGVAAALTNGQQRCQRCWKVFHIGPLAERLSYICWRCEYAICPNCRESDGRGGWKCCSCVKPMSLMRLFETTKSGREMVIRVMEFCDPRAERILKSFFRFASLYALSSTATAAAAARGTGVRQQLSTGVASRIKAHLDLIQRESPAPSSYSVSPGNPYVAGRDSASRLDDDEDRSTVLTARDSAAQPQRGLLGAISPNVWSADQSDKPHRHPQPISNFSNLSLYHSESAPPSRRRLAEEAMAAEIGSGVQGSFHDTSIDRLRVSESTHRTSTVLCGGVEKEGTQRSSGGSELLLPVSQRGSAHLRPPPALSSASASATQTSDSDPSRRTSHHRPVATVVPAASPHLCRDGSEKALFRDDEEEIVSPTLREPPTLRDAGRSSSGSGPLGPLAQAEAAAAAGGPEGRSESPAPRFPDFSTYLEDQALGVQPQTQHPHAVGFIHLDSVSISSDSESPSVMDLGIRRTVPTSGPISLTRTSAGGHRKSVPTTTLRQSPQSHPKSPSPQPSGSVRKYVGHPITSNCRSPGTKAGEPPHPKASPLSRHSSATAPPQPVSGLSTGTETAPSPAKRTTPLPESSAASSALQPVPSTAGSPLPAQASQPHSSTAKSSTTSSPNLAGKTTARSGAAAVPSAVQLVRTDSVLQAFERLASNIAERQRELERSHPVVLAASAGAKTPNPASRFTRYPYSQRAMQDTGLYGSSSSSRAAPTAAETAGALQRTASGVRFGRTGSNNPHLRPHKSTTLAPRGRTATVPATGTVGSGAGSKTTRVVHQSHTPATSVYTRLYGNGIRMPRYAAASHTNNNNNSTNATTTPRAGIMSRTTVPSRTATPTASSYYQHPHSAKNSPSAAGWSPAPDLLARVPSTHTYIRVASTASNAAPPLNRTDTAIPSRLQRSQSNPGSFSRTASRIAVGAVHLDPVVIPATRSAGRRSPTGLRSGSENSPQQHDGSASAPRHPTPSSAKAPTPLKRQETQYLVREPSTSDAFARIPTTKNFERLCSMNRNHGQGDHDGQSNSSTAPAGSPGYQAIAALANAGLDSGRSAGGHTPCSEGAASLPSRKPRLATSPSVEGGHPAQRSPRSLLLSTTPRGSPRVGYSTSPRPRLTSTTPRNTPAQHTVTSPSPSQPSMAGTPSPLPKRPPLTPTTSVSPAKSELLSPSQQSVLLLRTPGAGLPPPHPQTTWSPSATPQGTTPGKAAVVGGRLTKTTTAAVKQQQGGSAASPSTAAKGLGASPSTLKGRPKLSIQTSTLVSPRAKLLGTRVPPPSSATSRQSHASKTLMISTSRSPAASQIPKKRTGTSLRLK